MTETPPAVARESWLRLTLPSLAVAGGLSAIELARSRFQDSKVFVPTPFPEDWEPPARVPIEDVGIHSGPARLHAWWSPRRMSVGTVVYCHGSSGNVTDRVDVLRVLRRLRLDVLLFDYRGYGRSTGAPSEKGLYDDVRAVLDWVHENRGVSWDRVLLFGHSLGGAVAIEGASSRPVAGLVVQSTFTQLRDMARHAYPRTPLPWITRNLFRSIEKVGELEMPKLFIHGEDDEKVPLAMGRELFEAAQGDKTWHAVPGAGHNDVHAQRPIRYFLALRRFRRRVLG